MFRLLVSDAFRFVPGIFGRTSEGQVGIDLQEAVQSFPVRDAAIRGLMQRRQFVREIGFAGAGQSIVTEDFWTAGTWSFISGAGGSAPGGVGVVPADHDVLIRGVTIDHSAGSNKLVQATVLVQFPGLAPSGAPINILLGGTPAGASPVLDVSEAINAPYLPYPLERVPGQVISMRADVSAAGTVCITIDLISAPIGVIAFA